MIVKFKNGYQVQIRDCAGKSRKELIEIAKKAVKDAVTLEKRIDTNTSFMPTKMKAAIAAEDQDTFDRELKFLARDLEADLSESHKNYPKVYRKEVLEKLVKQYEDAYHLVEKADDKFGTDNAKVVYDKITTIRKNWGMEPKELVEDARDIPPYRVKITYANGEVTIKYVDDLTAAIKDIRRRIEAGKKDGNKVAVALVFDSMTDEIVLSSDHDADIRVEDADGDMKDPAVLGYIEYVDLGAKEKKFENADAARAELKKLLEIAKKTGEPVALAAILNADTEDVIEEVYRADTEVKDAPPPYFDPTDYPSIKSDYSVDRLSREARHLEKGSPILSELDDVHSEIDELIAKGSDALIDAGWSKDDARRAIATRYTALEKELRKNNLKDEARELHKKIRALEKAWDLRV
uniref:Uncharacterized protein n=1 Tax=Myoviridae sp. ctj3P51 TaxID=2826687 RepID=A0A8S5NQG5_9CAUD|nr:MAG TPA: hypothetical protein [Myoviridae sp. ctj3P51]